MIIESRLGRGVGGGACVPGAPGEGLGHEGLGHEGLGHEQQRGRGGGSSGAAAADSARRANSSAVAASLLQLLPATHAIAEHSPGSPPRPDGGRDERAGTTAATPRRSIGSTGATCAWDA